MISRVGALNRMYSSSVISPSERKVVSCITAVDRRK
jgi:hypothetical protein